MLCLMSSTLMKTRIRMIRFRATAQIRLMPPKFSHGRAWRSGCVAGGKCDLGNIAYRTNTVVRCDPATGKMIGNPEGEKLWQRPAYRPG